MTSQPTIRRATLDDVWACHEVQWASLKDLGARNGAPLPGTAADWWLGAEPLQRFLAAHAGEWWVAEDPDDPGRLIGYARSVERGGLIQLTEFFVLPTAQSRGVGRALIERAFPIGRGDIRSIISSTDVRALGRYYAAGTVVRFPILSIGGQPARAKVSGQLRPIQLESDAEPDLEAVREIEASLVEHARGLDEIRWLLDGREGYLYLRDGRPVGYGFVGNMGSGPVGAIEPGLLADVLLHLEDRAAERGMEQLGFEVPAPNAVATRHLLSRGFRIDPGMSLLMSDRPFGRFDRFLGFSPPVFL